METAARLLDLVPYIYRNQGISIEQLASDFSITRDEILSDLNTLWMCGETRFDLIDLEFDSGFVYIRNAQAINHVRSLSTQEMISIFFGLDLLKDELGDARPDLIDEIHALKARVSPELSSVVSANPAVSSALLDTINKGITKRSQLEIVYHSVADDRQTTRVIYPIEKIRRDGQDFLVAFCTVSDSQRTFRLDRISSALPIDAAEAKLPQTPQNQERISVTVKVRANKRRLLETFDRALDLGEGKYRVEIFNTAWLSREIIASGGDFELLEPEDLRREVARQAQLISLQYR